MRALLWPQMAFLATLLWAQPAHAAPVTCDSHEKVAAYLLKNYSEYLRHIASGRKGVRIEVYVSKKRTWTMVVVDRFGVVACLLLAGKNWRKQEARR